jgi:hypothetical protein
MMHQPHTWRLFWVAAVLILAGLGVAGCRAPAASASRSANEQQSPLVRQYVPGEMVRYVMTAVNQGRDSTLKYTAESEGRVVRSSDGHFFEETRWTRLVVNGQEIPLDQASQDFRQCLSLDAGYEMPMPDIRGINPMLIGPVFDLMTFYVDLHPNLHQHRLHKRGDRTRIAHNQPNSWADGTHVLVGEDCIDFELELIDVARQQAQLRVRHVPPQEMCIRLPAEWMRTPVGDAPNNWVQVQRNLGEASPSLPFTAAVGHETFDVVVTAHCPSGRIIAATMDNPVDVVQRRCRDEALTDCDDLEKFRIHRRIELRAQPQP